jgi:hypothetical protein
MSVDQGGKLTTRTGRGQGSTADGARQAGATRAEALRVRYDRATAAVDPPLAIVDEDAFDRNAADLTRRAQRWT